MDSSLTGVIIGALIGSIPACLATIVSSMENRAARKHELRKLDIEIYHREKIAAIKQYCQTLSTILEEIRSPENMIAYKTAHNILITMVSDEAYAEMNKVYKEIAMWHNQYLTVQSDYTFNIDIYDRYYSLLACLRKEMDTLHRSSGLGHNSFEIICASSEPSESAEQPKDSQTETPNSN